MEYNLLLVLLVVISVSLIALILIQHGKGADAGAAFGSGASGTVFGSKGATSFLGKLTAGLAIGFFIVCILLAYLIGHQNRSANTDNGSIVDQLEDNSAVPVIPEVNAPDIPVSSTEVQPADIPQVQEVAPATEPEAGAIPDVVPAVEMPVDAPQADDIPVSEVNEPAADVVDSAEQNLGAVTEDAAAGVMDKAEDALSTTIDSNTDKVEFVTEEAKQMAPDSSSELQEAAEEQIQTTN